MTILQMTNDCDINNQGCDNSRIVVIISAVGGVMLRDGGRQHRLLTVWPPVIVCIHHTRLAYLGSPGQTPQLGLHHGYAGKLRPLLLKVITAPLLVDCKAIQPTREIHDRLQVAEHTEDSTDPTFDWEAFWQLLKPQLYYFLAAMGSALIVALANVQVPILLGDVVNVVTNFNSEAANDGRDFIQEISAPCVKLIKLYLAQAIFTFSYITFLTRMGERMADSLRQQLFSALLEQDIAFYDQHKTGELVNRLTADVQDFKSSFKMCVSQGFRSVAQVLGCGISIYMISPKMAGMTAVLIPIIIGTGTALGNLLRAISREAQHQVARATGVADECLSNMRTVRAFAMEDAEKDLFAREVEKSRQLNELLGFGIGIFQAGSNLFLNFIVMGTLYIGGNLMSYNQIKPGDLMSFLVACQTIQRSLAQLGILFGTYVRGISAGARVFEYVKLEPTIPLRGGAKIPYHSLMGNIEFKNVSFAYPTRSDQEVLHNFSLHIPAGRVVALVGVSGGGKSTVAQLLERFYDVKSGSITLDGVDLHTLDPSWLRGRVIGFINQEPVLFATSILENIRYGYPDASDEEVIEAAKTANAHEFIKAFPRGYNTVVGERGVTVSGGQKQRIAIARALLKNPRILVLDEATSALDAESEAVVQAALENCIEGRTVLIIAHRLSTIQKANVIAVMAHGKLAEIGTHNQLKKLGGIYADLIRQQQKDENAAQRNFWGL
ncbi:mitochondrial potassium channel ATP-binding subunit isoform X3 [Procambarus clarkii]|uniref:mitochondrial potassium channel ATP-binding subunit isoform X3 n=1 Tax=Procambarus clarkii TaxID=6728 RepID=UPI0037449D09